MWPHGLCGYHNHWATRFPCSVHILTQGDRLMKSIVHQPRLEPVTEVCLELTFQKASSLERPTDAVTASRAGLTDLEARNLCPRGRVTGLYYGAEVP